MPVEHAERQKEYELRRRREKLVRVHCWVPRQDRQWFIDTATELRDARAAGVVPFIVSPVK